MSPISSVGLSVKEGWPVLVLMTQVVRRKVMRLLPGGEDSLVDKPHDDRRNGLEPPWEATSMDLDMCGLSPSKPIANVSDYNLK